VRKHRQRASPSFRSGTTKAPPVARSGSARFRPRPGRTHQLCRLSIPLHCNCASSVSVPLHSEVSKRARPDETGRAPKMPVRKDLAAARLAAANPCYAAGSPDVQQPRARDGSKWPRDFVRPRPAIRREALPVAEDQEIARDAAHGQDVSNSRGDGQPSRHFAGCVCETGRPRWKNQIGPTPRRWASQPAVSVLASAARTGHHSATLQRRGVGEPCHRAGATMPGHESRRPDKIA
jgi:hypothetical protein